MLQIEAIVVSRCFILTRPTLMLLMVMYLVMVDSLSPKDLPLTYQVMFM